MENVDAERQHAERLLYSMIPEATAIRLKNGEDPINTWEVWAEFILCTSFRSHCVCFEHILLPRHARCAKQRRRELKKWHEALIF